MTARDRALLEHGTHEVKNKEIVRLREDLSIVEGLYGYTVKQIREDEEWAKENPPFSFGQG